MVIIFLQLLVLVFLVIAPATQAMPKPQLQNGHMVPTDASEAKEYQYEEQRDHELQESINGGQSGWALYLISEGGNPKKVLNDNRPKRQETKPVPVPVAEPAQEPSNLPESYAGRFTGSAIALANKLAGAQKQAIAGEGEVSYGRKKRHDTGVPHSHPHPEPVSAPEPAKEPSNLPESYAGRFTGSAIALANKLAGAMKQAIAGDGEVSYGRKKRQTAFAGEIICTISIFFVAAIHRNVSLKLQNNLSIMMHQELENQLNFLTD